MNEASYLFLSPTEQEEQRRTFWSVFLLERLISCGRDRPVAISESSCNIQLPGTEETWDFGKIEVMPTLSMLASHNVDSVQVISPFALVIRLASILSRCTNVMLHANNSPSLHPPWDPQSEHFSICSDLLRIDNATSLATPLAEILTQQRVTYGHVIPHKVAHHYVARLISHLCKCILNHPFLLRRSLELMGVKAPAGFLSRAFWIAEDSATKILDVIEEFQNSGLCVVSSFSGYCCVLAGAFHATKASATADAVARSRHLDNLTRSLNHLRFLSKFWNNAKEVVSWCPVITGTCLEPSFGNESSTDQFIVGLLGEIF